jgi:hypothetical protein
MRELRTTAGHSSPVFALWSTASRFIATVPEKASLPSETAVIAPACRRTAAEGFHSSELGVEKAWSTNLPSKPAATSILNIFRCKGIVFGKKGQLDRAPLLAKYVAAASVGIRLLRIEPDRVVVVGQGPAEIAFRKSDIAAIVIADRLSRLELDRSVVVRHDPVEVALREPGTAAAAVAGHSFRIEPDRFIKVG